MCMLLCSIQSMSFYCVIQQLMCFLVVEYVKGLYLWTRHIAGDGLNDGEGLDR